MQNEDKVPVVNEFVSAFYWKEESSMFAFCLKKLNK